MNNKLDMIRKEAVVA